MRTNSDGVDGRGSSVPDRDSAGQELLTPGEVAKLFGVDPKTVARWASKGRLPTVRTLGGHRRYPKKAVEALLNRR